MQDAFAYCAEQVRTADRDRYLSALFAPGAQRGALYALYAFNAEIARVREVAREPLPGEIRLQWWNEVLSGERGTEAAANPIAAALLATVERYALSRRKLIDLIEARRFDLYDEPMATLEALETYASKTSSALFAAAAQILSGMTAETVSEPAGRANTTAALLRALPLHAARGQIFLPLDLLERYQVPTREVLARRSSSGLAAALAELRNTARHHLAAVRDRVAELPPSALPAFLPLAPLRPSLDRMERSDAFAPADIPAWRRQWLIWRAARNPARIAG